MSDGPYSPRRSSYRPGVGYLFLSGLTGVAKRLLSLKELRDACKQADKESDFQDRLEAFRERYSHRPAMMRRIKEL